MLSVELPDLALAVSVLFPGAESAAVMIPTTRLSQPGKEAELNDI